MHIINPDYEGHQIILNNANLFEIKGRYREGMQYNTYVEAQAALDASLDGAEKQKRTVLEIPVLDETGNRPEPVTPVWRALLAAWFAEPPEAVPAAEHIRVGAGWPVSGRAD